MWRHRKIELLNTNPKIQPLYLSIWRDVFAENDERYQLDATIMIYYHK